MIRINFKFDLDMFLSSHVHTETILVTTEYISGANKLVHLQVGETAQAIYKGLLIKTLHVNTGLHNEYFFYKKTYGSDKPKNISKNSFLEHIGKFKHDETEISQETLLKYRYDDKHGRNDSANIVVNHYKNNKSTAYIDFANMNEYVDFCLPDWLTASVE